MRGPKNPYRLTNLRNPIHGFSSSGFPFDEGKCFGRKKKYRIVAAVEGVGAQNLDFRTHRLSMDSVTQGKGCNRSHSAGFPRKRANCTGKEPGGTCGKHCTPLQG